MAVFDPLQTTESIGVPGLPGISGQPGANIVPGPGGPGYALWEPEFDLDTYRQDLGVGLEKIAVKRIWIDQRWDYYQGRHREKVLTQKLMAVMKMSYQALATMFTNYCKLVVNAPLSRLKVVGWKAEPPTSAANPAVEPDVADNASPQAAIKEAAEIWRQNDLDLEAEEVHRDALVAGEAFVIVWPRFDANGRAVVDDDGDTVYDVLRQDARNMHVEYATKRRRDIKWALKVWFDGQMWHAVLYYPNEVVRFMGEPKKKSGQNGETEGECPMDPQEWYPDLLNPGGAHDFGVVPVVRFSRSWDAHSTLDDVMPIQDRINKLTADKIVTAEFAAFPQRWVLTNDAPPDNLLKAGSGAVWVIPPTSENDEGEEAKSSVGQFPSADLGNYDKTIAQEVRAFFTVANLPRHLMVDPGVAPTGEAVKADEGPFIAEVTGYRDLFGPAWADVFALCGLFVAPVWKDAEVRNQLTQAQVMQALVAAGMPIALAAKLSLDLPDDMLKQLESLPGVLMPGATLNPPAGAAPPTEQPPDDTQVQPDDGQQVG